MEGLDGGDGRPEPTSGIPLCPAVNRSGVMKALQGGSVNDVAAGEDFDGLAIAITTLLIVHSTGRHFPNIARAAV